METKLEKKSYKSLIFLLIKQRNVINTLVRRAKEILVQNQKLKKIASEVEALKMSNKFYKENAEKNFQDFIDMASLKRDLEKEIAYLKGKLGERSERDEK